jgi:hypothetical protein
MYVMYDLEPWRPLQGSVRSAGSFGGSVGADEFGAAGSVATIRE